MFLVMNGLVMGAFLTKHLLFDFPFQTVYMLGKAKPGLDFVMPLSAHAGAHAAASLVIILMYKPEYWWLVLGEFVAHFMIDRMKCLYKPWPTGPWVAELKGKYLAQYYTAFGIDQWAHGICYVIMGIVLQ